MNDYYVYMYLDKDGCPRYIGKRRERRYLPIDHLHDNTKNIVFQRFLKKYLTNIKVHFLHENLTEQEAFAWEKYWIKYIGKRIDKTGTLLNLTDGGEGTAGIKQTQDWIDKRQTARALHNNFKHTEETKMKIRIARAKQIMPIGRKISQATKDKIGRANHGKRQPQATINRLALERIGHKHPNTASQYIGVFKNHKRWTAAFKGKYIGTFDTEIDAHNKYLEEKEKYLKNINKQEKENV